MKCYYDPVIFLAYIKFNLKMVTFNIIEQNSELIL